MEYDNLLAALNFALESHISILKPYRALSLYLDVTGDQRQILELGQTVLSHLEAYPIDKLVNSFSTEFVTVIDDIAQRQLGLKQYVAAEISYQRMLLLITQLGQIDEQQRAKMMASAYNQLGKVAQEQRQWVQAQQYYQQALQIYIAFNDHQGQAKLYQQLSEVALELHELIQAEQYSQQALQLYGEEYYQQTLQLYVDYNDLYKQADTDYRRGAMAQEQRQWVQAQQYYQQALQIYIAFNDHQGQAKLYHSLGQVLQQQSSWRQAAAKYLRGLRIVRRLDDYDNEIRFLIDVGRVYQDQDYRDKAIHYYEQALVIATTNYGSSHSIVNDIVTNISSIVQEREATLLRESSLASVSRFLEYAGITIGHVDSHYLLAVRASGVLQRYTPFVVFFLTGAISAEDLKELVEHSTNPVEGGQERIGILIYDKPLDAVVEIRISLLQLDSHFVLIPIPLVEVEQKVSDGAACKGLLADYVDHYLSTDIFDDRNAIHDPLFFFGRRELLHRLEVDLVKGQGIGLFGLRKSGKTSVLLQLCSILKKHPVVHIDLERYGGNRYGAKLFNHILQRLSTLIRERTPHLIPELEEFSSDLPASELTARFVQLMEVHAQALEKAGYELPIMCFLDEVERILPYATDSRERAEEFNACFGGFRALIQEQRLLGLLVTDVYPDCNRINEWPQEGVATNPVSNFFKEVFLGPFSEEETTTMITSLGRWRGRRFDAKTLARIHHESGGHPFVARQLASLLYNRITQTKATADGEALIAFSTAKRFMEKPFDFSNMLKQYFSESVWAPLKKRNFNLSMTILKMLAVSNRSDGWLIESALRAQISGSSTENELLDAFFWLEATGLILRNQIAGNDLYQLRVPLLGRWLLMDMTDKEFRRWQIV